MGACEFCGQKAGLFRKQHADCAAKHALAVEKIPTFFEQALASSVPACRFRGLVDDLAAAHYVNAAQTTVLAVAGIARMVDAVLADQVLSEQEDNRIRELREAFDITVPQLGPAGDRLVKAEI